MSESLEGCVLSFPVNYVLCALFTFKCSELKRPFECNRTECAARKKVDDFAVKKMLLKVRLLITSSS